MPEAQVLLGEPEIVRQLLAGRLLHDAWAGEGDQRAGLGDSHIAEAGERREYTGRRRVRHDDDHRPAGVVQILDGDTVFGSCISERIPSCMRAPPELVTATSGIARVGGALAGAGELLPTTLPIEPPMNAKSMTASPHGGRRSRRDRSPSHPRGPSSSRPRRSARCRDGDRRTRADPRNWRSAASSTNEPSSARDAIRGRRAHRKVVPALAAHPERLRSSSSSR